MNWTVLLAILTFSLSLIGTFVVRSGVLTSVHSFAQDPARGVFILVLLVIATGGALLLYALRIPQLKSGAPFNLVSREAGLTLNNVLLVSAAATVFLGTFYPLFIDLMGMGKISVGPPFYARTFVPIMMPLMFAMVIGPVLKWKRDTLSGALPKLKLALYASVAAVICCSCVQLGESSPERRRHRTCRLDHSRVALDAGPSHQAWLRESAASLTLASHAPRSFYGLVMAHLGLGVVVGAITVVSTWQQENILMMAPGGEASIAGYTVTLRDVVSGNGANYEAERATFDVSSGGSPLGVMSAERRFYGLQQRQTTHTGIRTNLVSNLYIALGEPDDNGRWTVRIYYHPLAPWLWFGGIIMAGGGFLSLSDRRFRVGAPQRAAATANLAPAIAGGRA